MQWTMLPRQFPTQEEVNRMLNNSTTRHTVLPTKEKTMEDREMTDEEKGAEKPNRRQMLKKILKRVKRHVQDEIKQTEKAEKVTVLLDNIHEVNERLERIEDRLNQPPVFDPNMRSMTPNEMRDSVHDVRLKVAALHGGTDRQFADLDKKLDLLIDKIAQIDLQIKGE